MRKERENISHLSTLNCIFVPTDFRHSPLGAAPPSPLATTVVAASSAGHPHLHRHHPVSSVIALPTAAHLPILADHMDMARPPHENPEYYRVVGVAAAAAAAAAAGTDGSHHRSAGVRIVAAAAPSSTTSAAVPVAIPVPAGFASAFSSSHHHHGHQQQQHQVSSSAPTVSARKELQQYRTY